MSTEVSSGEEMNGIERTEHFSPEYDVTYKWDTPYLDRLFAVLIEVIEAHGLGNDGWHSVRWEVYDQSIGLTVL
ncbi:hypothetical protein C2E23DRAFT_887580 [Lenzites betulinus]|nr:hypothetical protein C2E23DRAFT_887580 [Lenzites betulinus]